MSVASHFFRALFQLHVAGHLIPNIHDILSVDDSNTYPLPSHPALSLDAAHQMDPSQRAKFVQEVKKVLD